MKSKVYFVPVMDSDTDAMISEKLDRLLKGSRVLEFLGRGEKVAVKMHFGEEGNTAFVKPVFARMINVCPVNAITIENEASLIDKSLCIGCASCIGACPTMAMFVDVVSGGFVQEKMAEYASAVLRGKKACFINFAIDINKECDCWGQENPRIAPHVGIFASRDPVAIDKACLDQVNKACGRDIFRETHPERDGMVQLEHAGEIGSMEYELIEV
ncbi:MAG: DUF362 domain-containing protein [Candidatus Eremiobacteraeota bacterium]|nr:DUF362 domain-containing protein [Candidatus Eremiobacteraeota bacterium]